MGSGITAKIRAAWQAGLIDSAVDSATNASRILVDNATWYPMGGGKKVHAGSALTGATDGVYVLILIEGNGSMTGDVYLDLVTLGVPNLYIDEDEPGTIEVDVEWTEKYYA